MKLAYAARQMLLQQSSVTSLLGVDELGDPMLYVNQPEATIENTGKAMIVLTTVNGWGANGHNNARFPVLVMDIWADPTRNVDNSVRKKDADLKIEAVYEAADKFLHLESRSNPDGTSIIWGSLRVVSSERQNEPEIRPAFNDDGGLMGTVRYNAEI